MSDLEPVFTIKAKDNLAPGVVAHYAQLCSNLHLFWQHKQVRLALAEIEGWRGRNPDKCANPSHRHVSAGADTDPPKQPPTTDPPDITVGGRWRPRLGQGYHVTVQEVGDQWVKLGAPPALSWQWSVGREWFPTAYEPIPDSARDATAVSGRDEERPA